MDHRIALTLAISALAWLMTACSPPADQAETTWHEPPSEAAEVEPVKDGRPMLSQFSEDEISAIREFSDEAMMAMAEDNPACDLLTTEDLAEVFGGEWSDGNFRWFESELQIAPAALQGICVWQQLEFRTSATLRLYDWSELAWASLLQHDSAFARRFYDRALDDGPDLGRDAYRKPMDEAGHDGTCLALDRHIVCLSASARHTERWAEDDQRLLNRAIDRLVATGE